MKWWRKGKQRLADVQQEQQEIKSKTPRREELASRAEQHLRDDDPFGWAFHQALGGNP